VETGSLQAFATRNENLPESTKGITKLLPISTPRPSGGKKRNREENFRGITVDEDRNKKRTSTLYEPACLFCKPPPPPDAVFGMIIGTSGG
jgi:hypothetical protein